MKNTLFLIITLFTVSLVSAQNTPEIIFNENKEVILNGEKIDKTSDLEKVTSLLGEPVLYKEYPTGKMTYHYTDLGIAMHFYKDNLIFIGANFNWDGDKTFPETTYTGKLSIDSIEFDMNTTNEILSEIKVIDLVSLMPGMYMTDPNKEKTIVVVGFKDEKLTQIGFQFQ
ncbi:hypothetical protein GCM10011344_09090 [Dokdonia pacifica]|uniref:DUF7738 domain-containing protein n=1 Tax=Dokdonia pacifica TaxID=1627892 RepID=A0A238YSB7_9FLAO|nr:hypothetical protein [Dokdonia pacifica]GGG10609.1 hypothetical protein GCM10011344_09090 [Dokdonia pacifica]SNR73564.1 hypothetical protein SAMN06265376_102289 [Dokdonia pacifica]